MNFNTLRIVLVGTTHPGNIGAAARAMKAMGLQRLYLVAPKLFPHPQANELAAGADDVLQTAIVTDSLIKALEGCHLVFATSARPRELALPGLTPSNTADMIALADHTKEIAIVFGREHAGLTNDELLHCHYHIHIPTNEFFSSLNLAQAVQIMAYEIRMKLLTPNATTMAKQQQSEPPATVEEVEQFYEHLRQVLIDIDFLKLSNPKKLMQRLRRLFNRIQLEHLEVNILRGMLTHVQAAMAKKGTKSS